ncbi:MAG: AsnC family transcriptional regulator [Pseudonocardiales bacterium]|nr:MAG: AsnC family transcriptional regulator [Pseudonocardiales bacterium]
MGDDLDELAWSVLRELQSDGRASVAKLARRIRLSPTATADRIRRLEAKGIITGYAARVNLAKTGVDVMAIVRLEYPGRAREPLAHVFDKRPEVLECQRVTGDDCYVLKIAATSMDHLASVVDDLGDIGRVTTGVVYNEPLPYRGLLQPLAEPRRP